MAMEKVNFQCDIKKIEWRTARITERSETSMCQFNNIHSFTQLNDIGVAVSNVTRSLNSPTKSQKTIR